MKLIAVPFIAGILLASCASQSVPGSQPIDVNAAQTVAFQIATETYTSVVTPAFTLTSTITLTPTISPTSTADTRLTARYWREWPTTPELSSRAREILYNAITNSELDLHTFSKVGDCQMTSGTFLGGYANGKYNIPEGYEITVEWFSESMLNESVTAERGLGISSVLNPMFGFAAGYSPCLKNETPLDCELRTRRPLVVLIGMGTNWIPNAEVSFEKYLRQVVDKILQTGALPILATKADNVEGNWKLNEAIAQVAYDYDLPLVNVWRSVHDLPGGGIERKIYLTPDGWIRRNYAWLMTLERVRNVLDQ